MYSVHNFSRWLRIIIILGFITSSLVLTVLYAALKPTPVNSSASTDALVYTSLPRENVTIPPAAKPTENTPEATSPVVDLVKEAAPVTKQESKPETKQPSPTPATSKSLPLEPAAIINPPKVSAPIYSATSFSISEMLAGHNLAREDKGLLPLKWSDDLAADAQAWSEVLKSESCEMRHDLDSIHGENIFWQKQSGGDISGMVSRPSDANDWWINEENFYNYKKNTCQPGEQCGHYTQIVWSDTTTVGCGVSSCFEDKERIDIWVCRYNPPGNDGGRPY